MVSPIDPNEIRLTGENSFMRLSHEDGGSITTRASHWRVLFSPAGPGHVLFLRNELTDNQVRIYADNIALARWLQEEIESTIDSGALSDQTVPVAEASFSRHGDVRSFSTEKVVSRDADISLTWYDLGEPLLLHAEPGSTPGRSHGVYTVLIPAGKVQLTLNGRLAQGHAFPRAGGMGPPSTCCLAWSESWVRPR